MDGTYHKLIEGQWSNIFICKQDAMNFYVFFIITLTYELENKSKQSLQQRQVQFPKRQKVVD